MASSGLVISQIQGAAIVSFQGTAILDGTAVQAVADDLYRLVDQQARKAIVLDFAAVRFLSSAMLGVLITLHKKSADIKGRVVISGLRTDLHKVFKITRLDKLLEFADSEDDALSRLDIIPAG